MRRGLALGLLVGWLLGIGTGLLGVAVTGGWYEHRSPAVMGGEAERMLADGWEPSPADPRIFRRARFRLP